MSVSYLHCIVIIKYGWRDNLFIHLGSLDGILSILSIMEVNFGTLVIIIHRASCRGITENILQMVYIKTFQNTSVPV